MLVVLVLLTGVTLLLGYANKARCVGPEFDATGRSGPDYEVRIDRDVCYSDIQHLWLGRDIDQHVFPYVAGSITPEGALVGGSVEYPVLTGVLIWAGALLADNDGEFLLGSALLMAPFGLLTGWLLGRLARWRALLWALGPPVVLYAFHNWDLPVVACAVGAVFALHGMGSRRPLADRALVAAVLLGLGFAFKLYPGAFVLPLALYVLTMSRPGSLDWRGALRVPLAAAATVVLVNLPFALGGYEGWRASFTFQQMRKVDLTTNSIWYWGFRPESDPDNKAFQSLMDWLSPTLVLLSFAVAAAVGLWRWRRESVYPWIGVSAAILCGFLLLHKVHSPQYTLWLLPFFVLLQVPWRWVVGYLAVDLVMGIGIFRWFYTLDTGVGIGIYEGLAAQAVAVGVWGRAVLLVVLFVVFLRTPDPLAARERTDVPAAHG
nr:glycosyltransferase 87 family protein [Pseudonocardia nigra]